MKRLLRRPAVAVATASLLAVGLAAVPATIAQAATPTELFISEYIEGSSNNKAIEISNLTGAPVDLGAGDYDLKVYFNGSATAGLTIQLTGTVAAGDVHVVAQSAANATILAAADQTNGAGWYNGDDAVVLTKADAVVDAFGQTGFDPGTEWGSGLVSTADNTLRRGNAYCQGDTNAGDPFDPSVQWTGFATDTVDGLGVHSATCETPPPPPEADCDADIVTIGSVQGSGTATPVAGQTVRVEGVVVGDFQASGGLGGFFLQDAGDGDPATSDGIFVLSSEPVEVGDSVHVVGTAGENFGATRISAIDAAICPDGGDLPEPVELELPVQPSTYESLEGMYVTMPQTLTILEYFEFDRFGEIVLGTERQIQPTAIYDPGSPDAIALAAENAANRITVDDGRSESNPDPAIHPNGEEFTLENTFRGGDLVTGVTGVLDFAFSKWRIQPTQGAEYESVNERPDVPEVGGNFTVASFNVLNYFTTLNSRGAITEEEFERQEAKIVAALAEIDADVFGLIEIENNGDTAVGTLVQALNDVVGDGTYDFISTGVLGTDVITTALIYKPSAVTPVGDHAVLDSTVDPRFNDDHNRPALAQAFTDVESGATVAVVVNHLKSKGSACAGDPDKGDGQGNCNLTRKAAAEAMVDWLADEPTAAEAGHELIIGDLNSYDKEDPIDVFVGAGYTDLLLREQGEEAYSYVFDGQIGYLDYALAGTALAPKVTGAADWRINADEPDLIDYTMQFKKPAQDALFAPDPYRSSDHDPVIVGMDFIAPELEVTAESDVVFPPNAQWRTVAFDVDATDDSGEVDVEIVDTTAEGHKAEIRAVSDTEVEVLARQGAIYTVTFEATDPYGNVTTEVMTIRVLP
ncbi:ExeM/NucH family extracellular endonuclease [Agromyces sp. NPDC056523]|uniref:ExeM/NucH family extracellular endonuclease n=1 Tax=Agromyces sp. NPDC056523 TaxID=3345850 RepID=UPI00366DAA5B